MKSQQNIETFNTVINDWTTNTCRPRPNGDITNHSNLQVHEKDIKN